MGLQRTSHTAGMALARAWKQMSWFYYQYLLVTALYMLEPWERTVFSILPGPRVRGPGREHGGPGGTLPGPGPGGGGSRGRRGGPERASRVHGLVSSPRARGAEVPGPRAALPVGAWVGGRELLRSEAAGESLDPRWKRLYCWKKSPRAMANLPLGQSPVPVGGSGRVRGENPLRAWTPLTFNCP